MCNWRNVYVLLLNSVLESQIKRVFYKILIYVNFWWSLPYDALILAIQIKKLRINRKADRQLLAGASVAQKIHLQLFIHQRQDI